MELVPKEIDSYAEAHTTPPSPLLQELRELTLREMEFARMQVGAVEGTFLKMLVSLSRARRILEFGTFTGYSALMMAEALPDDGELITCDIDPEATAIAQRFWDRSPHGRKIQLRLGPALDTLPTLQGPFDLVFIDADKENYARYYDAVFDRVPPGGLIVADNTLWSGRVLDPQDDASRAIVAFNQKVQNDPRVENVLLSVRDGILLARKRSE